MRAHIIRISGFAAALFLLAGCPGPQEPAPTEPPAPDMAALCTSNGGNWSTEHNECVGGNPQWCTSAGGDLNTCASACRHQPEGTPCTLQCVLVCSF